ncbi:hypothetical protein L1987_00516 [Smallanthus sonchifolius]|uniref:Uncharacterized protein n=1 Tax=Smallanthus sonchifolius TaxID=185202 RepID=A0ACB9K2G3_9ASTR|nr:hypothetical protein L1987_00516 [Smallanthus sonchifolius]
MITSQIARKSPCTGTLGEGGFVAGDAFSLRGRDAIYLDDDRQWRWWWSRRQWRVPGVGKKKGAVVVVSPTVAGSWCGEEERGSAMATTNKMGMMSGECDLNLEELQSARFPEKLVEVSNMMELRPEGVRENFLKF